MGMYENLNSIFERHEVSEDARVEIRRLIATLGKDFERKGYSEGWEEGYLSCER